MLLVNVTSQSFAQADGQLVRLKTPSGDMYIEFFPEDAPNHVENFLKLTESKFYDGTIFHRIIKDFMIQGGDPKTKPGGYGSTSDWGTGNPGYTIDAEFNTIKHNRGIVSMARSPDPNSAGSQFFIVHKDSNFLDGQYTVFGRLVTQESFDTLDKIASLETVGHGNDTPYDWAKGEILKAVIVDRSEVSGILDLGDPERTTKPIVPANNQEVNNEKLGVSFTAPAGWLIQEPEKTQPGIPDIVIIGPQITEMNPVISITITDTDGKTLEERVSEIRDSLQHSIDTNQLTIIDEQKTTVGRNEAYETDAIGLFFSNNSTTNIKFKEILIATPEKFYALTYTYEEENFDNYLELFDETVTTFSIQSENSEPANENSTEGGGCLIATATFGSELAEPVQQLRELRDEKLLQTNSGTTFISGFNQFYYSFSPTIADWERQNSILKETVKITITPLLASLSILNHVELDSEESVLGFGIGIISLNIGMYIIAPIIGLLQLRKFL